MAVQEMQSYVGSVPGVIEVCPADHQVRRSSAVHRDPSGPVRHQKATARVSGARPSRGRTTERRHDGGGAKGSVRPVAVRRVGSERIADGGRAMSRSLVPAQAPVAPGRRVLVRSAGDVRSCRVEAPSAGRVVDDVPTWALVICGVLFGLAMLLALAFLGGPAYA